MRLYARAYIFASSEEPRCGSCTKHAAKHAFCYIPSFIACCQLDGASNAVQ
jgi:hypothetical protein